MDTKQIGYIICESAIPGFTETNIVKEENRSILKLGKNLKDEISHNSEFESVETIIDKDDEESLENIFMHLHPDYKLRRDIK